MRARVRLARWLGILLVAGAPGGARAEATLIGAPATAPLGVRGAFELGTRTLGLGLLWVDPLASAPEAPEAPPARFALAFEAALAPAEGVLSLRAAPVWRPWQAGLFALCAQAGLSLDTVWKGPFDLGGGPFGAITLGVGGPNWEVFLGPQAGVEAYLVSGGPRLALRAVLGVRGGLGPFFVEGVARGGIDLERGQSDTWRAEAIALVGVRAP